MVSTPPPAHAGEAQVDYHWLGKLARWLDLGRRKVAILVEGASAGGLRPLISTLMEHESPVVCFHATELLDVLDGSLVVLAVHEEELTWLNLNRPLVANKRLRLVLWLEFPLHRLRSKAPDFFDWISHVVRCPTRPPRFVSSELRDASAANRPVAWRGRDLDIALDAIGVGGVRIAGNKEFADVVAMSKSDTVPIWVDALDVWHSLRIELAMQHVRQPWWIVELPGFDNPRYITVSDETLGWEAATERLMSATAAADRSVAARVAALLEAKPNAIEQAVRAIASGMSMEALLRIDNVITTDAEGVAKQESAFAPAYEALIRQHAVALTSERAQSDAWVSVADRARSAGHPGIARYFAARAFVTALREPSRLRAQIAWAAACHEDGRWSEAHERFHRALESMENAPAEPQLLATLLTEQALALAREGKQADAAAEAGQGLDTWVTCSPTPTAQLELECFRVLGRSSTFGGGPATMAGWLAKLEMRWGDRHEGRAYSTLQRARDGDVEAQALLTTMLQRGTPWHGLIAVGIDFAGLQLENRRPLSAAITCVRTLRHLRALHGTDLHPQGVDARLLIGSALAEHDPARATAFVRRALADCEILGHGMNYPRAADAALLLAELLRHRGDIAASMELVERAGRIREELGIDGGSAAIALHATSSEPPVTAPRDSLYGRPGQDLIERARQGDFVARDTLAARYHPLIRRLLAGKVDPEDVDDLTQQAIVRTFESMDRFETDADVRRLLFTRVRWVLRDHYRRNERKLTVPLEEGLVDTTDSFDPESRLGELQNRAVLARALRAIPLDDQLVLYLYYFENSSFSEIAKRFGGALEPMIRSRLRRSKQSLEKALGSSAVGWEASPGASRDDGQGSADLLLQWIADMRQRAH